MKTFLNSIFVGLRKIQTLFKKNALNCNNLNCFQYHKFIVNT